MGEGIEIRCRNCGFSKEIWYGPGFMSSPRNPRTRARTLAGEFGRKPRQVMEEHPDAECSWYKPLFRCSCGNMSTKDAVVISEMGKMLYRPSMRCDLCHRKMWEVDEISYRMPLHCPKCGEEMEREQTVLWD